MSIDLKEISAAWWDSYFGTEQQKIHAKERLEICQQCPSLTIKFKKLKRMNVTVCGECGCPIDKKVFSSKFNACPLGKWQDVDEKNINLFKKGSII